MGLGHDHGNDNDQEDHDSDNHKTPSDGDYKDPCAGSKSTGESIPLTLRIGSIFIILVVSLAGIFIPFAFRKMKKDNLTILLTNGKLFGAGIMLATAFVHMSTESAEMLGDPCLPDSVSFYHPMPMFLSMLGIIMSHLLQVLSTGSRKSGDGIETRQKSIDKVKSDAIIADELPNVPSSSKENPKTMEHSNCHGHGALILDTEEDGNHQRIRLILLEAGVAVHSIIMGMALGSAGDGFLSLLVALNFHQLFEGIGLSSIIMERNMFRFSREFLICASIFSLSMPFGIMIGVFIRELENHATTILIVSGVLDSIAAGLLIFDALVGIIVPHFSSLQFAESTKGMKTLNLLTFWFGALIMSIIGFWA